MREVEVGDEGRTSEGFEGGVTASAVSMLGSVDIVVIVVRDVHWHFSSDDPTVEPV